MLARGGHEFIYYDFTVEKGFYSRSSYIPIITPYINKYYFPTYNTDPQYTDCTQKWMLM